MGSLRIGTTEIVYRIRRSERARRKRIVVRPGDVEVVVPKDAEMTGESGIEAFLQAKRRWLFDAVRDVESRQAKLYQQRYAGGAKLQYRGRWLMIEVCSGECRRVEVRCLSKFHVTTPHELSQEARPKAIKQAMEDWLQLKAERDLHFFSRKYAACLGVSPHGVRLAEARHKWGSCGKDGVIRIHWRLIQAPKIAMEYVVAHELTHLIYRNHSPEFWRKLSTGMPEWRRGKDALERWEVEHRAV